jgi:hypothetical protein
MKKLIIFIITFLIGSLVQSIVSKYIGGYWFPTDTFVIIFRICIALLISTYVTVKTNKII